MCECKRLVVWAEKFCCPREKTYRHGFHVDLELGDKSRDSLEISYLLTNCVRCWLADKGSVYGCHS